MVVFCYNGYHNNLSLAGNQINPIVPGRCTIHEVSIAENILHIVENAAAENNLIRVHKIILEIGQFAGVVVPSLEFAFSVINKGTILENAEIEIENPPGLLSCHACEAEYLADLDDLVCPVCQAEDFEILQGRDMLVKSITGD